MMQPKSGRKLVRNLNLERRGQEKYGSRRSNSRKSGLDPKVNGDVREAPCSPLAAAA